MLAFFWACCTTRSWLPLMFLKCLKSQLQKWYPNNPRSSSVYFIKTRTHLKATHRSPNKLSTLVQYNCLIQRLHPTFAKSLPLSLSFLIRDPILENLLYFAVLPVKILSIWNSFSSLSAFQLLDGFKRVGALASCRRIFSGVHVTYFHD